MTFFRGKSKMCIRKKCPNYVIHHVGTNGPNSELPPERMAKSTINVAKNNQSDSPILSISGIVPCDGNFNIKTMEVNKQLLKMCDKEKLLFNINPKNHLNKSTFHLNHNGYQKLGKVLEILSGAPILDFLKPIKEQILIQLFI